MIIGIGTDIAEVHRIAKSIENNSFKEKVFSHTEITYCEKKVNKAESFEDFEKIIENIKSDIENLNKIFDSRIRLGIMSALVVNAELNFNELKDLTKIEYNRFFRDVKFWEMVKGEKVFTFQLDSILLRSGIDEFLDYDLIYISGIVFIIWQGNLLIDSSLNIKYDWVTNPKKRLVIQSFLNTIYTSISLFIFILSKFNKVFLDIIFFEILP